MLRQATNKVFIEGILSEINLEYGSYVKNGATVENIGGHIKVLIKQVINGVEQVLDIPVYMFSLKYKRDGGINPSYTSIQKVKEELVSIAASGGEASADKIRISGASIRMNEYYNGNGDLVSYPRINASFVSKVTNDFRPQANWELEFAVSSKNYVVDKDGVEVEPKKLRVKAIVPQYGGKVNIIEMYATNPNVIDAVSTYWDEGCTYTAKGRLNFTTTTVEVVEECDFGEPDIRYRTNSVSELIITKGTQSPLEDDAAFSRADLAEALKAHKVYLEELKNKAMTKSTPAPTTSSEAFDLGF